MNAFQRLSDKVAYTMFQSINGDNRELTNLAFKCYRKRFWGIPPQTSDRPVCKLWWPEKIDLLLRSLEQTEAIKGDIVELGAYRGGSTLLIAEKLQALRSPRKLWALDSFCGYPTPTESDRMDDGKIHYKEGHHGDTSVEYVRKVLTLFGVNHYVNLAEGFFEETLPRYFTPTSTISLMLLDCNHYISTKFSLETLYPYLQPNGIALIDDYRRPEQPYHPEAPGVKKAVDEFLADKPEQLEHGAYSMWYFIKSSS